MRLGSTLFVGAFAVGLVAAGVKDAQACGGCFHPPAEIGSSVVSDHRMAFKLSREETVLWDQVRYTGSPEEFAWVLPVREGARVELSRDGWISALDASTRTTVTGPERSCGGGGGGGGGCASWSSESASMSGPSSGDPNFAGNGNVSVIEQKVIGPYQAVTLRANGGRGISEWLVANGFAIPDNVKPTVDAYTAEHFDFIALRLRPNQGVQAMRPVRVVTPGADTTLPLRMVAAGVGAKVGLTLWVIGEGRYHTQNFPNAVIDDERLVWDGAASRSNMTELQSEAFASGDGRTWLTECADRANVSSTSFDPSTRIFLSAAYNATCATRSSERERCSGDELPPEDGTPDGQDRDPADGGSDSGDASDDGGDASADGGDDASAPPPEEQCFKWVSGCDGFDDLEVATRGLHTSDIWVTRLRADLPVTALATDLRLEAAEQREVLAAHHTEKFSDPSFDPCAGVRAASDDDGGCGCRASRPFGSSIGTWLLVGLTAIAGSRLTRRRRQ